MREPKSSTLMLLGGIWLSTLTLASVVVNAPILASGILCFAGTGLIVSGLYELCHYN